MTNNPDGLFLFDQAVRHQPDIDEWLASEPADLFALARYWFERFRQCGDDVNELIHDGCPTACVQNAAFGYVNVFKAHVNVGFFTGAMLPDPEGLLEGAGKRMRHVKIRPGQFLQKEALRRLISNSYLDVKGRLSL